MADVTKAVKYQLDQIENCEGYSIGTANDEDGTVFTMTVSFINASSVGKAFIDATNNDSGLSETGNAQQKAKKELPAPTIAMVVPKSEAARKSTPAKVCDQDGFWIETDDDEDDFVQVAKMTPKGLIKLFIKNRYLDISKAN